MAAYDHYKSIPALPAKITRKKKKPKLVAVVDEDNCTGCQVCVPFCPVDCIEPVPAAKYQIPIPPSRSVSTNASAVRSVHAFVHN